MTAKPQKTVIITGTHHTPALELIKQLQNDQQYHWNIYYITHQLTTDTHIPNLLLPLLKNSLYQIPCGKFHRYSLAKTVNEIPKTFKALFSAFRLIKNISPDIIISFGGYISVPVIIASYFQSVTSITHEQTLTLSLSTLINSFFVKKVALSFPHPKCLSSKYIVTGNLLRRQIYNTDSILFKKLKLKFKKFPLVYITGGNQGSEFINQITQKLLPSLIKKFIVIHQTGIHQAPYFNSPRYLQFQYISPEDIGFVLNHAKIIISRSGANISQEIVSLNKSSILIPLPYSQQNEQTLNAQYVKNNLPGHTVVVSQSLASPPALLSAINKLSSTNVLPVKTPTVNLALLNLIHEII